MDPDLDALFGEEEEEATSSTSSAHPALVSAVESLLAEAWPVARGELLNEQAEGTSSKARDMSTMGSLETPMKGVELS